MHLKDVLELESKHVLINNHFKQGCFVVHKTNEFSAISLDQAHEQNNEIVKGNGGAVRLLTDVSPCVDGQ